MITYLLPLVFLAATLLWQGVAGAIPLPWGREPQEQEQHTNEEVLGVQNSVTTDPSPTPPLLPALPDLPLRGQGGPTSLPSTGSVQAVTVTTTSTPTPTASPSSTPTLTDDCDFEYHYDSRTDGDGNVDINHNCETKTKNNSNISNDVDINVNTGGTTTTSGDVKLDLSVKNEVE